ncbi:Uncharacterised protein [uncultured archaeon]|nr:Uncharacterised protein [uncultured archaeon]
MKSMKGQSAFEMLVSVATLLAFSLPIVLLAFSISHLGLEDLSLFHSRSTVQLVSDSINEVYLQGGDARRTVLIDLPSNAMNLTVSGNSITIYLSTASGPYAVSHPLLADAGNFTSMGAGLKQLSISANGTRVVLR